MRTRFWNIKMSIDTFIIIVLIAIAITAPLWNFILIYFYGLIFENKF